MGNFYDDNEDLQFYVDHGIDWEPIVELTEYGYRSEDGFRSAAEAVDFYREVLQAIGKLSADEIAPHAAKIDREGVAMKGGEVVLPKELATIFDKIKAMDIHGLAVPREFGGSACPLMVYNMMTELVSRADAAVSTHTSFHGGIALALLFYSVHEGSTEFDREGARIVDTRWRSAIEEIVRGDAWGSMDITEPDAGSDMAALRCKGEQDENGDWYLTGQKIFITSGHGKYHVVIARTEPSEGESAAPGLDGLSLFLVPLYEDTEGEGRKWLGTVERLEEKLGHHGSATCTIGFDRTPAQLIGRRGEGFKLMLLLMNNARIAVGMEGVGLCEAAYRMARDYAAERPSMGKTIDRHEMIADYLDEMRTDIQGMRALGFAAGYHEEIGRKSELDAHMTREPDGLEARRLRRQAADHIFKSRLLTPLFKYLAAEKAVEAARRCVQILGGVGYTKEYGAEKLLRDAMVLPIYEGTSQIQALMAMKDALQSVMRDPQGFVKRMAQSRWRSLSAMDPLERRVARLHTLSLAALQHLIQKTATQKLRGRPVTKWLKELSGGWDAKKDFAHAMLHAERLTRILADVAVVDALLEQARKAPERKDVLRRYLDRAEPRCRYLHEEITTRGDRLITELRAPEAQDRPKDAVR